MAKGSINKVILIGHLGADPEVRYTSSNMPVANIRMATSESWKNKETGGREERTEWHRVVFFTGLAKVAADYLRKGSHVYIEGRLQTRKWQTKEGQDRYSTEIVASDMQMLDKRGDAERMDMRSSSNTDIPGNTDDSGSAHEPASSRRQQQQPPSPSAQEEFDEDIPF